MVRGAGARPIRAGFDGYATLFEEAVAQLDGAPALLVVPAGVGSLAHAAALHCQRHPGWRVVTVEPESAPCIAAGLAAGHPVTTRTGTTTMAGLNCGTLRRSRSPTCSPPWTAASG